MYECSPAGNTATAHVPSASVSVHDFAFPAPAPDPASTHTPGNSSWRSSGVDLRGGRRGDPETEPGELSGDSAYCRLSPGNMPPKITTGKNSAWPIS